MFSIDISARFGGDCTKSAIENRFRRIKSDAKLINNAIAKGVDPITLNIGDAIGEVAIGSNTGGARHGQEFGITSHHNTQHIFLLFLDLPSNLFSGWVSFIDIYHRHCKMLWI